MQHSQQSQLVISGIIRQSGQSLRVIVSGGFGFTESKINITGHTQAMLFVGFSFKIFINRAFGSAEIVDAQPPNRVAEVVQSLLRLFQEYLRKLQKLSRTA